MYNTLGNGSSQSLGEQPDHQGLVLYCDGSPCFGHTGFILTTPVSSPYLCYSPISLLSLLGQHPVCGESSDSLHLLHLTDNKDWTIKEMAFSLGVGECAQLKIPCTVRSTEPRCSGPTEHHYRPQLFSAQTNALVTFGTGCP